MIFLLHTPVFPASTEMRNVRLAGGLCRRGRPQGRAVSTGPAAFSVPLESWEASERGSPLVCGRAHDCLPACISLFGQPHLDKGGACPGLPGARQTALHSEIITFRKMQTFFLICHSDHNLMHPELSCFFVLLLPLEFCRTWDMGGGRDCTYNGGPPSQEGTGNPPAFARVAEGQLTASQHRDTSRTGSRLPSS